MKIQCENCGTQHELDPPSWVVSSGRAFRFRCSACGHSQSVQPNAIPDAGEEREVEPTTMEEPADAPERQSSQGAPTRIDAPPQQKPDLTETEEADPSEDGVFLKQNGQIYMVRDWETLKRWIHERRVDRHDLVSEGGVRWEPVGSRADLMAAFSSGLPDLPTTEPTPFPFGSAETPFGRSGGGHMGWHDDDTEGVPTGLPPMPTEDRSPMPSIPPPALLDEDDTPFTAPRSSMTNLSAADTPDYGSRNPTIAPPAIAPPDIAPPALSDEDSEDSEPSAEAIATAPGSVMRHHSSPASLPPPDIGMPSPTGPIAVHDAQEGAWDDLMVTDAVSERTAPPAVQSLDFADEWDANHDRPASNNVLYWIAAVVVVFLSLIGAWWAFQPPTPTTANLPALPAPLEIPNPKATTAAPVAEPVAPQPDPNVQPPTPGPVAEVRPPKPVPTEPAAPKPEVPVPGPVAAQPTPKPPSPTPPKPAKSPRALLDKGWDQADWDPAAAAKTFTAVLAASPGNAEANYGRGYSMLKLGRNDDAVTYLCRARSSGASAGVLADVNMLLSSRSLSCP